MEGTEVVCGRTVAQPESPEKQGFTFEGWMLDGDDFSFTEMTIDRNSTLVAKWKANNGTEVVKVKFDSDGGSEVQTIELMKGSLLNLPKAPTKMGYIFDDWYLDGKVFDVTQKITKDITLKAKWEKRQTTTNNNNNSNTSNSGNKNDNKYTPNSVVESLSVRNLSLTVGKGTSTNVTVLPSSANYSLSIALNSNSKVATCVMTTKNIVTCDALSAGVAQIKIRDANSVQTAQFTVTVAADDKPQVTEPKPNEPDKPDDPDPKPPVEPDPPTPEKPDPDPDDPGDEPGGDDDAGDDDGGDEGDESGDNGGSTE